MPKTLLLAAGGAVLLLAAAFGVLRLSGLWDRMLPPAPRRPVDFATLEPGGRPNRWLVCPPGLCRRREPDAPSPVCDVPLDTLRAAVREMLAGAPGVSIEADDGETLDAVARTPLLRWPDRVTVRFLELGPETSTLALYSRSTYGHSDLGANARRVRAWLDALAERIPCRPPITPLSSGNP